MLGPATVRGRPVDPTLQARGKEFGRTRTQISLDLYNLLNTDATQTYNQAFVVNGAWLTPTGILAARFAKITGQIDF